MPLGLTNAPTTFMRLINEIFREHLGQFSVIYLYDIIIFSWTWDTHMQHVRQVLQILQEHKLQVKEKKSYFVRLQVPISSLWLAQRIFNQIQPASKHWNNGLYLLQLRSWKSFWVASISIVISFPLFQILLELCIISQILLLHSFKQKKKLLTLLGSKMHSTHPLFYIC